jgi:Ca2+:H+ antiporter
MASGQDNSASGARNNMPSANDISNPTSPLDTRHPLANVVSASQPDPGFPNSYQSADTVRRRPEPQTYG